MPRKFKEDREIAEYRDLMRTPDRYEEGFNLKTILGVLFIGLIMAPGSMYLGLVAGGGLGGAAEWVTIILFAEVARRSFTQLRRQETYLLYYVATAVLAAEAGIFGGLIWNQYLVQSPAAKGFGIAHLIPRWVAPQPDSEAIIQRTFFHSDWLPAIGVLLACVVISRIAWFSYGYILFRLTSDEERLPFPMAPIAALGATALAESTTKEQTWRWRVFSIGAMVGIVFGFLYIGVPTITGILFKGAKPLQLLPIPFADFTRTTERFLPAATIGITLHLGRILLGFLLPFWVVVGTFIGALSSIIANPILYKFGIINRWHPGMDVIQTTFCNSVDFWLSFGIGFAIAVFLIGIHNLQKGFREKRELRRGIRFSSPPPGRGNFPIPLSALAFIAITLASIWLCRILVPEFPIAFFIMFGFLITPLESYINARMIGLTGQWISIPMVREGTFILSGYKGTAIWFAPVPLSNYGGYAQKFREIELTGTRITSIIKAELFMIPIVLFCSFIFWSFIWKLGPIPSDRYPYAQKMWRLQSLNQCLWISGTAGGGIKEGAKVTKWPTKTLDDKTTWYWRCRASDGENLGPWMRAACFHIDSQAEPTEIEQPKAKESSIPPIKEGENLPPTAPTLRYPPDNATIRHLRPTLTVENALDPDSKVITYLFEIETSPDFDSPNKDSSEIRSWLRQAINFKYIGTGLGLALIFYSIMSSLGLPVLLVFGFLRNIGTLPHFVLPEIIGALLGRYYFAKRFGRKRWRSYTPVLLAGFACGMGLTGMGSVAIALISKSVTQLIF